MNAWQMVHDASPVVRAVMLVLTLASLLSWVVLVAKAIEFLHFRRALAHAGHILEEAGTLDEGIARTKTSGGIARALVMAAQTERTRSAASPDDREGLKERIALQLERLEAAEGRRLMRGTSLLASIGATSPFIGLFGTVWGIMTSFTGIAAAHANSLTVVAPGIAEALLATALGLAAAIPAVLIYNTLTRHCASCRARVADLSATVMCLISRDVGRPSSAGAHVVLLDHCMAGRE